MENKIPFTLHIFNTKFADDLAPCIASPSAAMILT